MVIHGNFNEFVLFLYLHMAHADGSMQHQEEMVVREKMSKLYPEHEDLNAIFSAALEQYRNCKPEEVPAIIRNSFEHFKSVTFSEKYRVYTDMYDIINSDGRVDSAEKSALDQLREIINLGITPGKSSQ
jgi:uncharacterized tellurite resistance protein B-like protein